jgi:hypothetical protein
VEHFARDEGVGCVGVIEERRLRGVADINRS